MEHCFSSCLIAATLASSFVPSTHSLGSVSSVSWSVLNWLMASLQHTNQCSRLVDFPSWQLELCLDVIERWWNCQPVFAVAFMASAVSFVYFDSLSDSLSVSRWHLVHPSSLGLHHIDECCYQPDSRAIVVTTEADSHCSSCWLGGSLGCWSSYYFIAICWCLMWHRYLLQSTRRFCSQFYYHFVLSVKTSAH